MTSIYILLYYIPVIKQHLLHLHQLILFSKVYIITYQLREVDLL